MPKTAKTSDETDARIAAQYHAIKERLINYYKKRKEKFNESLRKIREQLADDGGFDVSYTALRDVLTSENGKVPNMCIVLGLCRLWNLDYADIFAPPEGTVEVAPSSDALAAKVQILNDADYQGIFHGYIRSRNLERDEIMSFELEIKPKGSGISATMTTHSNPRKITGEVVPYSEVFTGTPLLLTKTQNVFILLTSEKGYFYCLFFKYRPYNFEKLYFRCGIAVSTESVANSLVLQNFVLFLQPVNENKKPYISGLLKVTDDYLWVPKSEVDALLEDEQFADLLSQYGGAFIGKEPREVYRIKATQILDFIEKKNDSEEICNAMRVVYMLQGKSIAPDSIAYSNLPGLSGFAKHYLQREQPSTN